MRIEEQTRIVNGAAIIFFKVGRQTIGITFFLHSHNKSMRLSCHSEKEIKRKIAR